MSRHKSGAIHVGVPVDDTAGARQTDACEPTIGLFDAQLWDDAPGRMTRNGLGSLEIGAGKTQSTSSSPFTGCAASILSQAVDVFGSSGFRGGRRFRLGPATGTPSLSKCHSPIGSTLGAVPRFGSLALAPTVSQTARLPPWLGLILPMRPGPCSFSLRVPASCETTCALCRSWPSSRLRWHRRDRPGRHSHTWLAGYARWPSLASADLGFICRGLLAECSAVHRAGWRHTFPQR